MAEGAARPERTEADDHAGAQPRYEPPRVDDLGTLTEVTGAVGRGIVEFFSRS